MKTGKIISVILIAVMAACTFIPASLAASGIRFTAEISAEDTWIPPGGAVDFTVLIENCGDVGIDRFEIITPDANLVGKYGKLAAGESISVSLKPIIFNKPGEYPVELFVAGYHGRDSLTVHTNEIIITVSSEPEPAPTTEPAAMPEPAEPSAAQPDGAVSGVSAEAEPSAAAVEVVAVTFNDNVIYIVVGVMGALAAGVVVAVVVIAAGKKRK